MSSYTPKGLHVLALYAYGQLLLRFVLCLAWAAAGAIELKISLDDDEESNVKFFLRRIAEPVVTFGAVAFFIGLYGALTKDVAVTVIASAAYCVGFFVAVILATITTIFDATYPEEKASEYFGEIIQYSLPFLSGAVALVVLFQQKAPSSRRILATGYALTFFAGIIAFMGIAATIHAIVHTGQWHVLELALSIILYLATSEFFLQLQLEQESAEDAARRAAEQILQSYATKAA